jgi:hypothetical protein
MALQSSEVLPDNTLEEFRIEFNKLVTDVSGLSLGNTFDTQIIFEGDTDDNFETGISVTDPTADRSIVFPDQSGNVLLDSANIALGDNIELQFGTGTDLKIYHDGSHSYIEDAGTGNLKIQGSQVDIIGSGETMATFVDDGAVTLYHNNVAIVATTATGITVSGDDLTMSTNTDGHLLIADGTNFNPVAITDLSEISTVASGDTLLAVDASGGNLKKIARSVLVAGLATSSAISNLSEDDTPQLGGNLDMNGSDIVTTSNATIDLAPNGTGTVVVRGNTNSGTIVFNCEDNSHGQTLKAQPHSASVTNTMLLPAGANSTLVSLVSTDTLTNKTLTSPVLNTATVGTSIVPTSADGATLGTASVEFSDLFLADAGTIQFGDNQEITLTHVADVGLTLTHVTAGDNLPVVLQLKSEEDVVVADEVIASLEFAAGDSDGTDGATVAAGIHAIAEGTFSASANATKLVFTTGVSETAAASATAKMTLSSGGNLTVVGEVVGTGFTGTLDGILGSGTAAAATTTTLASTTITASGIVKTDDTTDATSTTDGSLQTDGGLSVALDAILGNDVKLLSDASVLAFGGNSEVTLTHVHNDGLLLNDDMQLQFRDSAINIRSDADGDLDINADDEIELNSTLIDINGAVDVSGTYTGGGLMTTGGNIVIPDGGNIGVASDTNAMSISSIGIVSLTATNAMKLNVGTTAQRPTGAAGLIRYNSTTSGFEGYGAAWGALGGGATGGGSDTVFIENQDDVTADYTVTTGSNALSVGPITVATGVTVTVPTGNRWLVL